jgi:hypothetical protein
MKAFGDHSKLVLLLPVMSLKLRISAMTPIELWLLKLGGLTPVMLLGLSLFELLGFPLFKFKASKFSDIKSP